MWGVGGVEQVSFYYYESKFKIKIFFFWRGGTGGGRGARVSDFFLQRIQI